MKPTPRMQKLHFVGIGGAGMSALAEAMAGFGFIIHGSDRADSPVLRRLQGLGITVFVGHEAGHMDPGCDAVVFSAAVGPDNPELRAARELDIPVVRRAELLGLLMARHHGLAVAGTHGKTTTTGMLVHILRAAGADPTWIAGGVWAGGAAGRAGTGDMLVAEADEFDRAFLALRPVSAIVTNVDADHLDVYGDMAGVEAAFTTFLNALPFHGVAVVNGEDPGMQRVLGRVSTRIRTYGFSTGDYQARHLESSASGTRFSLWGHGETIGKVHLRVPGNHNVSNALAAAALALEEGVSFGAVEEGLGVFPGMRRRLERVGARHGVTILDDYAHHPSEVAATLQAARLFTPGRLCVLFQPHLYSRTQQLMGEFGQAFLACDRLWVLPVYPAREAPIPGVEGDALVADTRRKGHADAHFLSERSRAIADVVQSLRPGDVCLTMGAGDVGELATGILEALR